MSLKMFMKQTLLFFCFCFLVKINNAYILEQEKYLCKKSHALAGLKRFRGSNPIGKQFWYSISCIKIETCNETCEWSSKCSIDRYGNNLYLGGISATYDIEKKQHLTFLCCNGTQIQQINCSPFVTYTSETFEIVQSKSKIVRQAHTDQSSVFYIGMEMCTYDKVKMRKKSFCHLPTNRDTIVASALTPISLAALAGLAIIRVEQPLPRTTTLPPICTCRLYCDQCTIGCQANAGFVCDQFGFCGFTRLPCQ